MRCDGLQILTFPENMRPMTDRRLPSLAKWPFYCADLVLLGLAYWILNHYPHPLSLGTAILMVGCVVLAAVISILPFRMEYQTAVKFSESDGLTDAVAQIQAVEEVAEKIRIATGQWQGVQEESAKTVTAAKEVSERIVAEANAFGEFMQKANDSEKATLRLEVDKLRRAEGQWLQVLVHLLDHTYALHQAGARSGQPSLEAQIGRFQEACRDVARRVGLAPFETAAGEVFDGEQHEVPEGQPQPVAEARVAQTLAAGYTYQGRLLRRSLVTVQQDEPAPSSPQEIILAETEPAVEIVAQEESANLASPAEPEGSVSESRGGTTSDAAFRLESDQLSAADKDKPPRV